MIIEMKIIIKIKSSLSWQHLITTLYVLIVIILFASSAVGAGRGWLNGNVTELLIYSWWQAYGRELQDTARIHFIYFTTGMAVKAARATHGSGARINLLNKRLHYQLTTLIPCKLCWIVTLKISYRRLYLTGIGGAVEWGWFGIRAPKSVSKGMRRQHMLASIKRVSTKYTVYFRIIRSICSSLQKEKGVHLIASVDDWQNNKEHPSTSKQTLKLLLF